MVSTKEVQKCHLSVRIYQQDPCGRLDISALCHKGLQSYCSSWELMASQELFSLRGIATLNQLINTKGLEKGISIGKVMELLQICTSSNGIYWRLGILLCIWCALYRWNTLFLCAESTLNHSLVYAENLHRASGPARAKTT